jgi:hypothetical protein
MIPESVLPAMIGALVGGVVTVLGWITNYYLGRSKDIDNVKPGFVISNNKSKNFMHLFGVLLSSRELFMKLPDSVCLFELMVLQIVQDLHHKMMRFIDFLMKTITYKSILKSPRSFVKKYTYCMTESCLKVLLIFLSIKS